MEHNSPEDRTLHIESLPENPPDWKNYSSYDLAEVLRLATITLAEVNAPELNICYQAAQLINVWLVEKYDDILRAVAEGTIPKNRELHEWRMYQVRLSTILTAFVIKDPRKTTGDWISDKYHGVPAYLEAADYLDYIANNYEASNTDKSSTRIPEVDMTIAVKERASDLKAVAIRMRENPNSGPTEILKNVNVFGKFGVWSICVGYVFPIALYVRSEEEILGTPKYYYNVEINHLFGTLLPYLQDIELMDLVENIFHFGRNCDTI